MSSSRQTAEPDIEAIYHFAEEQARAGVAPADIKIRLIERGLSGDLAAIVVENLSPDATPTPRPVGAMQDRPMRYVGAMQDPPRGSHSEEGQRNMVFGALWCVGGIVVTAVTYNAAEGGGRYVVAWGAILFGAIQFFRGVIQSASE